MQQDTQQEPQQETEAERKARFTIDEETVKKLDEENRMKDEAVREQMEKMALQFSGDYL